jgi:hypothetical protein
LDPRKEKGCCTRYTIGYKNRNPPPNGQTAQSKGLFPYSLGKRFRHS